MRGVNRSICILAVILSLVLAPALAVIKTGDLSTGHDIEVMDESSWEAVKIANYQVNQLPDPAEPGGYVELRWKVENLGADDADNVMFEILPEYPFSLPPGEDAVQKVGSFWDRQIGDNGLILYYKLKVDENAVEGDNQIKIRYSLDNGENWNVFKFDTRIQTHDAMISINSVNVEEGALSPGKEAKVDINLENLADSYLKNIKVRLVLDDIPIAPIGSSNERYIELMGPAEEKSATFTLMAESDASSKVYKVPVEMAFQDELGNTYSSSSHIGLIIGDVPDILAQIEEGKAGSNGQTIVSFKIINRGVTDIKFVTASLASNKEYEVIGSSDYYIGSIDSDDYENAEFKIKTKTTKPLNLPLKLIFKDANNRQYDKEYALELKPGEVPKGGISIVGILIVIVIVVAGFFVFRHYRKKKQHKH